MLRHYDYRALLPPPPMIDADAAFADATITPMLRTLRYCHVISMLMLPRRYEAAV